MGLIGAVDFGVLCIASFAGVAKTALAQQPMRMSIIPRVAISGRWCLVSIPMMLVVAEACIISRVDRARGSL